MVTTSSSGRSMGRVTFVSRVHFPAPSMLALSYSSPGMVVRPASRMTTPIPTFFQRYNPRRMTKAKGESIQGVGPVSWLKRPFSAKTRLTTITMADTGSTMGNSKAMARPFPPLARLLQQQGEKQRQGQDERQAAGQEQKGVFQRQQEQPVPEELGIVLQPHKPPPAQANGKGAQERIAKGQHQKGQQAHHRGSCQQQSDGCLSPFHSATSVSSCCSKSWATFSTSSVLGV